MGIANRNKFWHAYTQVQPVAPWNQFLQFCRCVEHENFPVVHDGDALAELVCLFHIMCGEQNGHTLLIERADAIPEEEPRLRIKAIGWLIQKDNVWGMH